MSAQMHRRVLFVFLSLYFVATWTSMAAMEIFGWSTFALTLAYAFRGADEIKFRDLDHAMPWKTGLALFVITVLGILVNGRPDADWNLAIGSQRWVFLYPVLAYAIVVRPPQLRAYSYFAIFASIIAVYAIFQSVTGIDFLRSDHRAVWPIFIKSSREFWRSAGLFGSPLQYGYVVGLHVCLFLAMALLTLRKSEYKRLFIISIVTYVIVTLSLITTFTRGAWIAMAISHTMIAWLVAPRLGLGIFTGVLVAVGSLFAFVDQFRVRFLTLFDMNFMSNADRSLLWQVNWEMFKEFPILGIGHQENERLSGEYVAKLGHPGAFTGHAHNNYLQMLAGTGVTGFACYMFIIVFMLWITWRLWKSLPEDLLWPRALALGALGAQIHLHVGGLTECNFKTGVTNHNFMLIWAIVIGLTVLNEKGLLRKRLSGLPPGAR